MTQYVVCVDHDSSGDSPWIVGLFSNRGAADKWAAKHLANVTVAWWIDELVTPALYEDAWKVPSPQKSHKETLK